MHSVAMLSTDLSVDVEPCLHTFRKIFLNVVCRIYILVFALGKRRVESRTQFLIEAWVDRRNAYIVYRVGKLMNRNIL